MKREMALRDADLLYTKPDLRVGDLPVLSEPTKATSHSDYLEQMGRTIQKMRMRAEAAEKTLRGYL